MTLNDPEVVVLTDAEMVAATDPIACKVVAAAYWLDGQVDEFDTLAAMLAVRTAYEQEANTRATDWQRSLLPPAWVLWRASDELTVFGWIPDPDTLASSEAALGASRVEIAAQAYRAGDARSRGWLWGRWYSQLVPDGEWGAAHCADVTAEITERQFESYRSRGWQDDGEA